jgi:hydroxymethylglutaryl-CoA lyase
MRFDGAMKGFGGCPMAEYKLVGNIDTDLMIPYFKELGLLKNINEEALLKAGEMASKIFV